MQVEWLTPKEAHAELNRVLPVPISLPTVYRMIRAQKLRTRKKLGGGTANRAHLLVESASVNELIAKEKLST